MGVGAPLQQALQHNPDSPSGEHGGPLGVSPRIAPASSHSFTSAHNGPFQHVRVFLPPFHDLSPGARKQPHLWLAPKTFSKTLPVAP